MAKIKLCDRCGKSMVSDVGEELSGIEVIVYPASETSKSSPEFYKRQAGEYELGRWYAICYECLIDTILGKKRRKRLYKE